MIEYNWFTVLMITGKKHFCLLNEIVATLDCKSTSPAYKIIGIKIKLKYQK